MLIDTHVHLNHAELSADLAGVVARAAEAGVGGFVIVGWDLESSRHAVALAESDERFFATVGIHPHNAESWNPAAEMQLRDMLSHPKVVALGEIGLDYYRDLSPRAAQESAFREQIALARESNKPIVIHCREAYADTLAILESDATKIPVLLHCFAGTPSESERATSHGWYLGVGGSVTFKNSGDLRSVVRNAPQDLILLETDAPYLSPAPFRGKFPNEPARVAFVAEKIAELRGESVEAVAEYTTANALQLFPELTSANLNLYSV